MLFAFSDWKSGTKPPKSWDAADAVDDGWTKEQIETLMRETVRDWLPPEAENDNMEMTDADWANMHQQQADAPAVGVDLPAVKEIATEAEPVEPDACKGDEAQVRDGLTINRARDGAPILDQNDPMPSARALVFDRFTKRGVRTLHHYRGTFWRWDGSCYRHADNDSMQAQTWTYLDAARTYGKDDTVLPFRPAKKAVDNVSAAFKAVCNLPADIEAPAWLEQGDGKVSPAELLPVGNGLLHLPSGRLLPPSPEFFCLNASPVPFDPEAAEPMQWLRFLKMIWGDDAQSIEALQDIFGYLLSPDTSQQKIPLIVGPKRSGKGTIARILTALVGQGSVAAPTLASLATNFGLAPLIGKSVAIIGDARLGGKADQSAIAERLLSISGEDALTIDRKFETGWTGRLGVRFFINSNELPRLADASGALASRFLVLTMTKSFYGNEDRDLANRLLKELPGILLWAREGYLRLKARGYFIPPDSAREAVEELEALGSPIMAFVKSRCTVAPGHRVEIDDLFAEWRSWCEASGRKEAGTKQSFGRDLRAAVAGLAVSQPRVGGVQLRFYEGISIRENSVPSYPDEF